GQAEYGFSQQEAGVISAPNRAHGLRTILDPSGMKVIPRTPDAPAFEVRLSLAAWGRSGSMKPVKPGTPVATGARAEIVHGGVTQWFLNEERGLEHGFTILSPPSGGEGPLILRVSFGGNVILVRSGE